MKSPSFRDLFRGKKVLVVGHTGFKGSWLSLWLTSLGADVVGYSLYLPSTPCNFSVCDLTHHLTHVEGDVRDLDGLRRVFDYHLPEVVFYLAAQPIVRRSYAEPKLTFDTNVGGTVNLLECLRLTSTVKAAVIITSDKCYKNVEWVWGYRENDALGGDDPYGASKGCAEIVCNSYARSFFDKSDFPRIATTRAGNVIGGGDWAADRIVPDCVRSWAEGKEVVVRNPRATRPWQHVLEPLSGYLWLGANLLQTRQFHNEPFNFGPDQKVNKTVANLIEAFILSWGPAKWREEQVGTPIKENTLLKLSCDKALSLLGWHPVLSFQETVRMTSDWYRDFYSGHKDMRRYSLDQIAEYGELALKRNLSWTQKVNET